MKKIACLLKGYPRLSETFIAQEILALEQSGIDIVIYSLRHPTDTEMHPVHEEIKAKVRYLPEYLYRHPLRVLAGLAHCLFHCQFKRAFRVFLEDFRRDFSLNRIRRMGQALVLCREIEPDRNWIYAHFLHTPASVARYGSILMGLPWSCSAHAKDIWTSPEWELSEKIESLEWLVTCTESNCEYLKSISKAPDKVELLYHGLDLSRFRQTVAQDEAPRIEQRPMTILSVGRAVNKKGYDILLSALARLPESLNWRFIHIGGGVLKDVLASQAIELNIDHHIEWLGARNARDVLQAYRTADMFVLPSRIDKNGDRDGLPNVLMEAMSQGLPCISTNISGIPEIIQHRKNGILVEPEDDQSLTDSILELANDVDLRDQLGEAGRLRVFNEFSLHQNINALIAKFC